MLVISLTILYLSRTPRISTRSFLFRFRVSLSCEILSFCFPHLVIRLRFSTSDEPRCESVSVWILEEIAARSTLLQVLHVLINLEARFFYDSSDRRLSLGWPHDMMRQSSRHVYLSFFPSRSFHILISKRVITRAIRSRSPSSSQQCLLLCG